MFNQGSNSKDIFEVDLFTCEILVYNKTDISILGKLYFDSWLHLHGGENICTLQEKMRIVLRISDYKIMC